jgi:hypothetical protein
VILILALLIIPGLCTCFLFPVASEAGRPGLKFDPTALPDGQTGVSYDVTISVSQNVTPVYDFFLSNETTLPPGLELVFIKNESTVRISGIPTQTGSYSFTLGAACYGTSINGQVGLQDYTLVIR